MQILIDNNNYITQIVCDGAEIASDKRIELETPDNFEEIFDNFSCYKYENGQLILDENRKIEYDLELTKENIRINRSNICFPIINRGVLWYNMLSEKQRNELNTWYQKWLDAPETLDVPETPNWIKELTI